MQRKILQFYLSHHFMLQGWSRSIDDKVLYKVLPEVKISKAKKKFAIVLPSFLQQKGISFRPNQYLVLLFNSTLIATAFWCDDPGYLFLKEQNSDFQLIY